MARAQTLINALVSVFSDPQALFSGFVDLTDPSDSRHDGKEHGYPSHIAPAAAAAHE